jgi:hypothetical protein
MEKFEKYKIKASKRMLLLLAGFFWSLAGARIMMLGFWDLSTNTARPLLYLLISVVTFVVFFTAIFNKLVTKHTRRIMNSSLTRHCTFSFFDLKGYLMIILMMTGGIALRNSGLVWPSLLGSFYLGLGTALLLAGLKFLKVASFDFGRLMEVQNEN